MSRADFEDAYVDEIDGLRRSYMELSDGTHVLRFIYRTLGYIGADKQQVTDAMNCALDIIYLALKRDHGGGIIIWRRHIEISEELDSETGEYFCKASARLATSPPISEEVWQELKAPVEGNRYADLRVDQSMATRLKPTPVIADYAATG